MAGGRTKSQVLAALKDGDLERLDALPAGRLIKALIPAVNRAEPEIHRPAIEAMGRAAARLAGEDLEAVREIIRRLAWSLNDESGAIGWGAAQAMGEILARLKPLALEFSPLLISYLRFDPGSPDFPPLQRGALWAAARLAQAHPDLARPAAPLLTRHLRDEDPEVRGLAAWLAGLIGDRALIPELEFLADDASPVEIFTGDLVERTRVADLARRSLSELNG